jgi:hypothetical protein
MILNLLLVAVFVIPLAAEALLWLGVNKTQTAVASIAANTSVPECLAAQCRDVEVWWLLLDLERGITYAAALSVLLVYNALRLIMTLWLAPLRDEEDRSGFSPRRWPVHAKPYGPVDPLPEEARWSALVSRIRESYGWLVPVHWIMTVLFAAALLMFAVRLWNVLTTHVLIPAG